LERETPDGSNGIKFTAIPSFPCKPHHLFKKKLHKITNKHKKNKIKKKNSTKFQFFKFPKIPKKNQKFQKKNQKNLTPGKLKLSI
jgi:hypothetical protein